MILAGESSRKLAVKCMCDLMFEVGAKRGCVVSSQLVRHVWSSVCMCLYVGACVRGVLGVVEW